MSVNAAASEASQSTCLHDCTFKFASTNRTGPRLRQMQNSSLMMSQSNRTSTFQALKPVSKCSSDTFTASKAITKHHCPTFWSLLSCFGSRLIISVVKKQSLNCNTGVYKITEVLQALRLPALAHSELSLCQLQLQHFCRPLHFNKLHRPEASSLSWRPCLPEPS